MLAEIEWNFMTIMASAIVIVPVVAILAEYWAKVERTRSENDLKRSMVQRGMSVDEIERVLSARTPKYQEKE